MKADIYSRTAVMMAVLRAYHTADAPPRIFEDPIARALVSPAECEFFERTCIQLLESVEAVAAGSEHRAAVYRGMRAGPGVGALVRARYVEERLLDAVAAGVRQYVIIGAGLDTFAFRRPDLGEYLRIVEIDHPATQALKRARLDAAGLLPPSNLSFAAADLEREPLASALDRTPYDRASPAFFAWPGVTQYLTSEAVFRTLASIPAVGAPGSRIVFDYFEGAAFATDAPSRVRFLLQRAAELGEPMLAGLNPTRLGAELARSGLQLREDLHPPDIQSRYLGATDGFRAVEYWHLAEARC